MSAIWNIWISATNFLLFAVCLRVFLRCRYSNKFHLPQNNIAFHIACKNKISTMKMGCIPFSYQLFAFIAKRIQSKWINQTDWTPFLCYMKMKTPKWKQQRKETEKGGELEGEIDRMQEKSDKHAQAHNHNIEWIHTVEAWNVRL